MKVTIEIDCTPEEARAALGLPDIGPLQEEILAGLGARLAEAAGQFDPEAALKAWMGASAEGVDRMTRLWKQAAAGGDKG